MGCERIDPLKPGDKVAIRNYTSRRTHLNRTGRIIGSPPPSRYSGNGEIVGVHGTLEAHFASRQTTTSDSALIGEKWRNNNRSNG